MIKLFKMFKKEKQLKTKTYWVVVSTTSGDKFTLTIKAVDRDHLLNQVDDTIQEGYQIVDFGLE